jgi:hypothetical protein
MLKLITIYIVVLVLIINESNQQETVHIRHKRWLYDCSEGECSEAIVSCSEIKCFGKNQCIKCIDDYNYDCKKCAQQIFSKFNMFDGKFICNENDALQQKVCQLYCQGLFYDKGECKRNENNIPQCFCDNKKAIAETTKKLEKTTLKPTTTVTQATSTKQLATTKISTLKDNNECNY